MMLACALTCLAASAPVSAQVAARSSEYRPAPLIGGGFKDKRRSANRWWVRGFSLQRRALELALYRGALLVRAGGFPHMQVVKISLSSTESLPGVVASHDAEFELVGVNDPDAPVPCENRKRNMDMCRTLATDDAMREFGRLLGRTDAEIAADLAAVGATG